MSSTKRRTGPYPRSGKSSKMSSNLTLRESRFPFLLCRTSPRSSFLRHDRGIASCLPIQWLSILMPISSERQYKRKIKRWGFRKHATSEDYARVENLLSAPNTTAVEDIASSTGIPMTDKKIRRYIKSKIKSSLQFNGEALPLFSSHFSAWAL